jgi:DNA polymerase-1
MKLIRCEDAKIPMGQTLAVDTETTGLTSRDCDLLGISLAWHSASGEIEATYYPVGMLSTMFNPNPNLPGYLDLLARVFAGASTLAFHNAAFDLRFIAKHVGLPIEKVDCTYVMARALAKPKLGLLPLWHAEVKDKSGVAPEWLEEQSKMKEHRGNLKNQDPELVAKYASLDAGMTLQLYEELIQQVSGPVQTKIHALDRLTMLETTKMERRGIPVDLAWAARTQAEFQTRLEELQAELAKHGIKNPASTRQVAAGLEALGLALGERTETGQLLTNKRVLETLSAEHPVAAHLVEYRQVAKAIGTWLTSVQEQAYDGRWRGEWDMAGTTSGRFSCSDPNLQAIPVEDRGMTYGSLAGLFKAPEGRQLWGFDLKQADLRMATMTSCDNVMAEVFAAGQDPYAAMATRIWGRVDPQLRQNAKRFSLAAINAIGARTAAERFEVSVDEAAKVLEEFRKTFFALNYAGKNYERRATEDGEVILWTGRRVLVPQAEPHKAFSRVVQGGVAEVMKVAMVRVSRIEGADIVAQIHDSLVVEIDQDRADELVPAISEAMRGACPAGVCNRTKPSVQMLVDASSWPKN